MVRIGSDAADAVIIDILGANLAISCRVIIVHVDCSLSYMFSVTVCNVLASV